MEVDSTPNSVADAAKFSLLGKNVENDKRLRQLMDCAHRFREQNPQCFPKEEEG